LAHRRRRAGLLAVVAGLSAATAAAGEGFRTDAPAMLAGLGGWSVEPVFTVGETIGDYTPPGVLDGIGAFARADGTVRVLVNHELDRDAGAPYLLTNGAELTGARVSVFDIDSRSRRIRRAGLAYATVFDRDGMAVAEAAQIAGGLGWFCSAVGVARGTYGVVDDLFFAPEEASPGRDAAGGTIWALDVAEGALHAVPAIGRGAWENLAPVETGRADRVAVLLGDDVAGAPLWLYVGDKAGAGDGGVLDRNGLARGTLYAWVPDQDVRTPAGLAAAGSALDGRFMPVPVRDAGGYLEAPALRAEAYARGAYRFARPEDLATDPRDGHRVAFAATGQGEPLDGRTDNWGTVYLVDVRFGVGDGDIAARLSVLYDGDIYDDPAVPGAPDPDFGLRSPDNLAWANDGFLYVQEDRATTPAGLFGKDSGREASIWRLDAATGAIARIAEIDRAAVSPADAHDAKAGTIGAWESSGVLDVTPLFDTAPGETLLIATVQAHGVRDGAIGGDSRLVAGGQLVLLSNRAASGR